MKYVNIALNLYNRLVVPQGPQLDWKNGKAFSSQEKSGNFEQTGKAGKITSKYWKSSGISDKWYFLFLVIFN